MTEYAAVVKVNIEVEGEKTEIEQFQYFETLAEAQNASEIVYECVDNVCTPYNCIN
jgi:hypothetical protein